MVQARAVLLVQQALCQLSHFPQLTSPPPPFYLYAQCQIEMGKKREKELASREGLSLTPCFTLSPGGLAYAEGSPEMENSSISP